MQEQPFESLCAFLEKQEADKQKRAEQHTKQLVRTDRVREQLAHATSQKVHEQEARIDRLYFWLFVLSVLCVCQFFYVLTI